MKFVPRLVSSWLIAAVAALALLACDKADDRAKAADAQRSSAQSPASSTLPPAPPPSQTAQTDTRTDANASETAKGRDAPMKPMSKDEEDKAMPQPGQVNDHSTVAEDPKQPDESK